jgi:DNA-binding Lrp family transcriptional regulator
VIGHGREGIGQRRRGVLRLKRTLIVSHEVLSHLKERRKGSHARRAKVPSLKTRKDLAVDETDVRILKAVQEDCRTPLEIIARKLRVPKSTVHYRVKRLEQAGVIEHYFAKLNAAKLGKDYLVVILARAKYGHHYHERIGRKVAAIPGVWAVYYVLGENDFVLLARANDRDDYMHMLEMISSMPDIERTNTQVVAKVIKEDARIMLA